MKRLILADAGPLYAAVDPHDQHHARARQELSRLEVDRLAVAVLQPTLMEAYTLVLNRLGIRASLAWLREIEIGTLVINPTIDDYAAGRGVVATFPDQRLTLFDSVLAISSQRLGTPIWTYDHHFEILRAAVWRPSG